MTTKSFESSWDIPSLGGRIRRGLHNVVAAGLIAFALTACATPPEDPEELAAYEQANDPLEPMNRAIFEFNLVVDEAVLRPAAKAYELLPDLVRDGIRNFIRHLKTPVIIANDLMQGEVDRAGETMGRFFFNTLVGGGFFDPAGEAGVTYHEEDFGQTLAVWGVDSGPYLMLPLLGPSNFRDTGGRVVDHYLDPINYWADNSARDWPEYSGAIRGVTEAVDTRSRNYRQLEDLQATSLDFYATVRSLYRQRRQVLIENSDDEGDSVTPTPSLGQSPSASSTPEQNTVGPQATIPD